MSVSHTMTSAAASSDCIRLLSLRYSAEGRPNFLSKSYVNMPTCTLQATGPKMETKIRSIKLVTLSDCKLGIGRYPNFDYNAGGGGATGNIVTLSDGVFNVQFEAGTVKIPPVCYSTTKLLGIPLPPPLRIDVDPQVLEGMINTKTGNVELKFIARFLFSAGPYKAPALLVDTLLTTGQTSGKIRSSEGVKLDSNGRCRLVGTAPLDRVNDFFMDNFLSLPTDCLAEMSARFEFDY